MLHAATRQTVTWLEVHTLFGQQASEKKLAGIPKIPPSNARSDNTGPAPIGRLARSTLLLTQPLERPPPFAHMRTQT